MDGSGAGGQLVSHRVDEGKVCRRVGVVPFATPWLCALLLVVFPAADILLQRHVAQARDAGWSRFIPSDTHWSAAETSPQPSDSHRHRNLK